MKKNKILKKTKFFHVLLKNYGLGFFKVKYIFSLFGLPLNIRNFLISKELFNNIQTFIFKTFYIENELQFIESKYFTYLKSLKIYNSYRHVHKLPVRGQRTHSNAKTQKRLDCRLFKTKFKKTNIQRNFKNNRD